MANRKILTNIKKLSSCWIASEHHPGGMKGIESLLMEQQQKNPQTLGGLHSSQTSNFAVLNISIPATAECGITKGNEEDSLDSGGATRITIWNLTVLKCVTWIYIQCVRGREGEDQSLHALSLLAAHPGSFVVITSRGKGRCW